MLTFGYRALARSCADDRTAVSQNSGMASNFNALAGRNTDLGPELGPSRRGMARHQPGKENYLMNDTLIRLTGLWENQTKDGAHLLQRRVRRREGAAVQG